MKLARVAAWLLTSLSLLILGGCVRYEDSIEIDQNGKGTAKFVMSRPVFNAIQKVQFYELDNAFSKEGLSKDLPDSVKLTFNRKEEGDRVEVSATYTFDDINTLVGWAAKKPFHPFNSLSVKRVDSSLEVTRSIKPVKDYAEEVRKSMPDTVITFRLKCSGAVETHNATRVDNGTLIWEIKAVDLVENGKDMKAAFSFGMPIWMYGLLALMVFLPAVLVVIFVRRKKAPVSA